MSNAEINNELMVLANFYGTIAASNGIEPAIIKKCNHNLERILDQLDKATNYLLSLSSGIIV